MTETTLMLTAQISDAERQQLKRIAKSKGMTLSGLVGQMVRETIKDYSSSGLSSSNGLIPHGEAGEIRDSVLL